MTSSRTLFAAVLVTGALTAVLVGWFGSGWHAIEREQRGLVTSAQAHAADGAAELADALAARLEQLRADESMRPYFHYQNLFHDPRGASAGWSVVPSPLASGPADRMIAAHFQIDGAGTLSSPTGNAEVPETDNPAAGDRALLGELARLEGDLIQKPDPVQVAMATPQPAPTPAQPEYEWVYENVKDDKPTAVKKDWVGSDKVKTKVKDLEPQVVTLDPDVYQQNLNSNEVFNSVKGSKRPLVKTKANNAPVQMQAPVQQAPSQVPMQAPAKPVPQPAPVQQAPVQQAPARQDLTQQQAIAPPSAAASHPVRRRRLVQRPAPPPPPPAPVTITVAPLAWRAEVISGQPALVALRRVTTPDGTLTQGLVVPVDRAREWLAEHDPDATLVAARDTPGGAAAPVALGNIGWWVTVDDRAALADAARLGDGLESQFLGRFIPVAFLAAACAALVILLTARAEKLARQRARFAAAAAHELRTPLAGIQLYGDMLVDGLGDPTKHKDYARRVAEEASRLGRVVANVLGFSQLERKSLAVRIEAADVVAALRDVIERAEPGLTRGGAVVELDAPGEVRARFDRDAVSRIVGNLLDNAEKYTREHADRRITVAVRPSESVVEVEVIDRGPGLPAALRRRRFQPFSRGTGDDGPPGLGLGLALSQSLARAMGGDLGWRDQSEGATFVLTLPAA